MRETLCPKAAGGEPGVTSCLASSIKGYDQMRSPKAFFVFVFFVLELCRHPNRDDKERTERGQSKVDLSCSVFTCVVHQLFMSAQCREFGFCVSDRRAVFECSPYSK